jgi:signal transduction histidine kinase/AmiR/NasT family two-component response regulator
MPDMQEDAWLLIDDLQKENKRLTRELLMARETLDRVKRLSRAKDQYANVIHAEREKQAQYINLVFENSPDIILLLDKDKRILYAANVFLEKTGIENFGLINGMLMTEVFARYMEDDTLDHITAACRAAVENKVSAAIEKSIDFGGNGAYSFYLIHFTPMFDNDGVYTGALMLFNDMTEILHAKQNAERANNAKSMFLATMSHEIRTPLNAIMGFTEIELQKNLPVDTRDNLDKILSAGEDLMHIINDILDISKIDTGNLEIVSNGYAPASVINDSVALNVVRIKNKPIAFKLQINPNIPARLLGDDLRIKQVINNLLSNAFKYTKEGQVCFKVDCKPTGNDDVINIIFSVSDTGVGIKDEDKARLFSEYTQLYTKYNRAIEGTGLGLSITKKILMLMGGDISFESEWNKGSVFTAWFPQTVINHAPLGEEAVRGLESMNFTEDCAKINKHIKRALMPYGRVLVVDDVAVNLEVARGLLLPYGLQVETALSGTEAIDLIRKGSPRFNAVFMDHMMPHLDGEEATRIIRQEIGSDYARSVPIIALTANAVKENRDHLLQNGFTSFLSKPIDIFDLDKILNEFVRNKMDGRGGAAGGVPQSSAAAPDDSVSLDLESVEGLDIRGGLAQYGSSAIYLGILASYVKHAPLFGRELGGLISDRSMLPDYAVKVHGLKGASYGICAKFFGDEAFELEKLAKAGSYEEAAAKTPALLAGLDRLVADIASLIERSRPVSGAKSAKPSKSKADRVLLEKLLDASRRYKSSLMEELIAELDQYHYAQDEGLVSWLKEQVENLEYEAVAEKLEAVLSQAGG